MTTKTVEGRIACIKDLPIRYGSHPPSGNGAPPAAACVMELVAWVRGEPWSDRPECTSLVIGAFLRRWNDGIADDASRTRLLLPLIPLVMDTAGSSALERRRAFMAADWSIRVLYPLLLDEIGRAGDAAALRSLAPLVDDATANAARAVAIQVCDAASAADAADAADAVFAVSAASAVFAAYEAYAAYAASAVSAASAADAAYAAYAAYEASAVSAASAVFAADAVSWKELVETAKTVGYSAARALADTMFAEGRLSNPWKNGDQIRDAIETSAQELVRRMAELKDEPGTVR